MPQVFQPRSNTIARAMLIAIVLLLCLGGWVVYAVYWSPFSTRVRVPLDQPVPFSHEHHTSGLGIDCRYCHTSVETSAYAGIPATETCMTCHSQLWTDAPMLAPVRESLATQTPLEWNRVHDLPDFVYFNHSIHVQKGIGCSTCHGRVDRMPLTWQDKTLYMKWCLECHRDPEKSLRPRSEIFNMAWTPAKDQLARGKELASQYRLRDHLTDCSLCHR